MSHNVGFIGTGLMGQPIALNVLAAGNPLWVYSRTPAKADPLVEKGARRCASPREVAQSADVIITMVSDTPDVEEVVLGADGVIHGAGPGKVVVDMSTIAAPATRRIAERLGAAGIEMLDAPVSGGDIGARQGSLSIMVGGKPEVFERVKPLFEAMGENIVHIGDSGAGQVAKSCNQIVAALHIQAAAEALLLARACGVDPAKVRQALLGGFAQSRALEVHGQRMLDRNFVPGFKCRLHKKDMHIVKQTLADYGLELDGADLMLHSYDAAVEAGFGEDDNSSILRVMERRNGAEV